MIEAAMRLVVEGGEEAFSLREAARVVGVTANAAYRHFPSKSALATAVAAQGFSLLAQRMQTAMESASRHAKKEPPSVARFKATGRAYVEFALENSRLFRLMFGDHGHCCLVVETDEQQASATPTPYEILGQVLNDLVEEKILTRQRREGAELKAWSVVHGFALLALDRQAAFSSGQQHSSALESVLNFAVAGICDPLENEKPQIS
jgi:AcrR family transcriptional regulator